MALSGTLTATRSSRTFKIEWTAVQNQLANTSTITLHYWWVVNVDTWCSGTSILTNLAGQEQRKTNVGKIGFAIKNDEGGTEIYGQKGTVDCGTHEFTVQHASDGKGVFQLSSMFAYGSSIDSWKQTIEVELVLDTILRETKVSCPSGYENSAVSVSLSIASPTFTHKLTYSLNGRAEVQIATGVKSATYTWTLPEILSYCSATQKELPCIVYCYTYDSDGAQIAKTSASMKIFLSESLRKPTLSVEYGCTDYSGLTGNAQTLIYNMSAVTVKATANASGSAVISEISCAGKELQSGVTATYQAVNDNNFSVSAVDSRGFSTAIAKSFTFVPYIKPTCSFDAKIDIESGSMAIVAQGQAFHGNFGVADNTVRAYARVRESGGQWRAWQELTSSFSAGNAWSAQGVIQSTAYDVKWETEVKVQDALRTVTAEVQVISGLPAYYWNDEEFISRVPIKAPSVISDEIDADTIEVESLSCLEGLNTLDANVTNRLNAKHISDVVKLLGNDGEIPSGADINEYKDFGLYSVFSDANARGIANIPVNLAGVLIVRSATGSEKRHVTESGSTSPWCYIIQIYISYHADVYIRHVMSNGSGVWTYGEWRSMINTETPIPEPTHKVAFGSISVSANKAVTIDYSSAGFTSVPKVCVTYSKTGANVSGSWNCLKVYNKTTASAVVAVGGSGSTAYDADWIAVGV